LNDIRVRIGVAAAVVIVVAALGSQFLAVSRTGRPGETPAPTPTPARLPVSGGLEPGSYLMPAQWGGVPFSFTVPQGWAIDRDGFISKDTSGSVTESTTGVLLAAFKVDHVYADACRHGTLEPISSSVESLATALANQAGRETSDPLDVFMDGYPGQRVELAAPTDLSKCGGFLHTWSEVGGDQTGGWPAGPGQTDDIYILDVSGTRLVIVAARWPETTPQDVVELDRVVASIRIK